MTNYVATKLILTVLITLFVLAPVSSAQATTTAQEKCAAFVDQLIADDYTGLIWMDQRAVAPITTCQKASEEVPNDPRFQFGVAKNKELWAASAAQLHEAMDLVGTITNYEPAQFQHLLYFWKDLDRQFPLRLKTRSLSFYKDSAPKELIDQLSRSKILVVKEFTLSYALRHDFTQYLHAIKRLSMSVKPVSVNQGLLQLMGLGGRQRDKKAG